MHCYHQYWTSYQTHNITPVVIPGPHSQDARERTMQKLCPVYSTAWQKGSRSTNDFLHVPGLRSAALGDGEGIVWPVDIIFFFGQGSGVIDKTCDCLLAAKWMTYKHACNTGIITKYAKSWLESNSLSVIKQPAVPKGMKSTPTTMKIAALCAVKFIQSIHDILSSMTVHHIQ